MDPIDSCLRMRCECDLHLAKKLSEHEEEWNIEHHRKWGDNPFDGDLSCRASKKKTTTTSTTTTTTTTSTVTTAGSVTEDYYDPLTFDDAESEDDLSFVTHQDGQYEDEDSDWFWVSSSTEPATVTVTATIATSTLLANAASTTIQEFQAEAMTSAARPLVGYDDESQDEADDNIENIENSENSERDTQPATVIQIISVFFFEDQRVMRIINKYQKYSTTVV